MNLQRHEKDGEVTDEATVKERKTEFHHLGTPLEQTILPLQQPRYEQGEVERIIRQASTLQDAHHQTMSREQVEAIAAEVGIEPRFVHQALKLEQGKIAAVPQQSEQQLSVGIAEPVRTYRMAAAVGVFGFVLSLLLVMVRGSGSNALLQFVAVVLPACFALALGVLSRSRRSGAIFGAATGVALIAAILVNGAHFDGVPLFTFLIGSGALLGMTGAEVRRQGSKRQVTNRSNRTVTRKRAL